MKLLNIFKKEVKSTSKANIQKLAKNQLEKVIGGSGPDTGIDGSVETTVVKSKSNIKNN